MRPIDVENVNNILIICLSHQPAQENKVNHLTLPCDLITLCVLTFLPFAIISFRCTDTTAFPLCSGKCYCPITIHPVTPQQPHLKTFHLAPDKETIERAQRFSAQRDIRDETHRSLKSASKRERDEWVHSSFFPLLSYFIWNIEKYLHLIHEIIFKSKNDNTCYNLLMWVIPTLSLILIISVSSSLHRHHPCLRLVLRASVISL